VHTGLVQFAIAWSEAAADVDLEVLDPTGELAETGHPTKSGLVKERDCPGPNAECRGQNMENVFQQAGEPLRGRYRVRVRLEKLGGSLPPIRVTLGARVGPKSHAARLELERPEDTRELDFRL
jgi:tRNA (guanosine-2'-O-)-methyltransferase